jgi:hypothetical protein
MEPNRKPPLNYVEVTEQRRLNEAREKGIPWKKWGPYLSERQWGTVREDYSAGGNAWDYFTHDQSRSRAYRWGPEMVMETPKTAIAHMTREQVEGQKV